MEECAGGSSVLMFAIYTYRRMIHVSLLPGATLCENDRQKKKDGFVRK